MDNLTRLIAQHEGFRPRVYLDSRGVETIGYGFAIHDLELTEAESLDMLYYRIVQVRTHLYLYHWFRELDVVRQAAMIDLAYDVGVNGLLHFVCMIAHLREHEWRAASEEMLRSRWATEVGDRARSDATIILTGEWPDEVHTEP